MYREYHQDYRNVEFDGPGEVCQPEEDWIDTEGCTSGAMQLQMLSLTGSVSFIVQTSKSREGPWTDYATLPGTGSPPLPDASEEYAVHAGLTTGTDVNPMYHFDRYMRWRIVATGAGQVCFRLSFVFKG
jgi:hypothetical protein